MRNREAARYARWAAAVAIALSLAVAGVYVQRAIRRTRAFRSLPRLVASTIEQQSANFTTPTSSRAAPCLPSALPAPLNSRIKIARC